MANCVHHPNKPADQTCNSCHEPVCEDCIVQYNPETKCKYCYANEIKLSAYERITKIRCAFIFTGISIIIPFLVLMFAGYDFVRSLATGLLWGSLVSFCSLFDTIVPKRLAIPAIYIAYKISKKFYVFYVIYEFIDIVIILMIAGLLSLLYNIRKILKYKKLYLQIIKDADEFIANYNRYFYHSVNYGSSNYDNTVCQQQDKTDFFAGCVDIPSVKERYHSLSLLYHPDKQHGDTSSFQEINNQYQEMLEKFN